MAKMLGKHIKLLGPYGLACSCCHENPPAGIFRRKKRRNTKRGERNAWKTLVRKEMD
jgi:hypothetical protein